MSFNRDSQQPGWAAPLPPPNWQPVPPPLPPPNWQQTPPPGYMPPPGYDGMPGVYPSPRKSHLPKIIGALVLIIVLVLGSLAVIGYLAGKQDEGKTYFSLSAPGDQCDLPNHISTATTDETVYFVVNMKDTLASSEDVTLIEKFTGAQVDSAVIPGDSTGKDFSCVTYPPGLNFEMPGTYTIELDHDGQMEATGDITIGAGDGGVTTIPSSSPSRLK